MVELSILITLNIIGLLLNYLIIRTNAILTFKAMDREQELKKVMQHMQSISAQRESRESAGVN